MADPFDISAMFSDPTLTSLPDTSAPGMDFSSFFSPTESLGTALTPDMGTAPTDTSLSSLADPMGSFGLGGTPSQGLPSGAVNPGMLQSIMNWFTTTSPQGGAGGQGGGMTAGMDPMQKLLLTLGLGGAGAGLIQSLMGGGATTTQQTKSAMTPQEQNLINQTQGTLSGLQGLAQNQELQNLVKQLSSGQLPISPDLVSQVTNAFQASAGQNVQNAVQNARARGFQGGGDLLSGAAGPVFAQSNAQLQGDISNALLQAGLQLPQMASNIQTGLVNNAAVPLQGQENLLSLLQGLRPQTTSITQPGGILSSLTEAGPLLGGLGGLIGGLQQGQNQQAQNQLMMAMLKQAQGSGGMSGIGGANLAGVTG